MEGGEISVATAVATTAVVIGYYYFVVRKQPKQATLGDFHEEEPRNTEDVPRMPE